MILPRMSGALDWFVSYTAADERWAEWIAWQLEEQGFTVKLQKWDVPASANFAVEMHEAASKAERTLAVLSAAYCQSGFGAAEWAAAFVQDPTGKDGKLLPVRIADFKPPGLFAGIVGIDLFGKSEREARAALLAGVKRERGKPEGAPDFPAHAAVTHAPCDASTAPGFPSALPAIFTLPFRRNPFFAGRAEALAALRSALGRGPSAAPSPAQAIHGLGGVGKTQLAVEYAWANASEYEAVLWAVADSPERLRANLAALAASNALGLPERAAPEQSVRLEAVLHWLKTHQRWLLILDGADSPAAASAALEVVPASTTGHLIITSRRTDWPLSVSSLPVAVLPEPAATRFLVERTKRAGAEPGSADDARAVAAELGCLPLAL
ncbi:MAG TPA: toll/interleukin-1 receptor domain-containing protein, partial [Polyangiaceae bacterium]|nr:toll/interleukin-1 receptor domain-containing protein [Polyangiaceae bacterium]